MSSIKRFLILTVPFYFIINLTHAQWIQTGGPPVSRVNVLLVDSNYIYAGTSSRVYTTTDDGTTWTSSSEGLTGMDVLVLSMAGETPIAGIYSGGAFFAYGFAEAWDPLGTGMGGVTVKSIAYFQSNVIAGTPDSGCILYESAPDWHAIPDLDGIYVQAFTIKGTAIYAGTAANGVRRSSDGENWIARNSGLSSLTVHAIGVCGNNLFAGTAAGVFLSTNDGGNWTAVNSGLAVTNVYAFCSSDTNIFAGTDRGLFLSRNRGTSWTSTGLADTNVRALAIKGTYLFAGTYTGKVWKRPLSELITAVKGPTSELPNHFSLEQNYPNPFNPTTNISFSVGTYGYMSLRIFDILGHEVATLANEIKPAGTYQVEWNATGFPSGVYFYRLNSGSYSETRKLLLLK
jgi:hypothetical protein